MTIDTENLIESIMENLDSIKLVKSEDIPNIDLYMDQVTTFMDRNLKSSLRKSDVDKVLTKTMINNYAKNDLLPSPEKKKYSKEHVLVLIFIYYLKNILSISDIQNILNPITDKYFGNKDGLSVIDIYDEVTKLEHFHIDSLKEDVKKKYEEASKEFGDVSDEDKEFLQVFSFICMLTFDVYVKKLMIEKILDDYTSSKVNTGEATTKKASKKTEKK